MKENKMQSHFRMRECLESFNTIILPPIIDDLYAIGITNEAKDIELTVTPGKYIHKATLNNAENKYLDQTKQDQTRKVIEQALKSTGHGLTYINKAFEVYEKEYGYSYNVEIFMEIIKSLEKKDGVAIEVNVFNPDKTKLAAFEIESAQQSSDAIPKYPPKAQSIPTNSMTNHGRYEQATSQSIPFFEQHMRLQDAYKLKLYDKIDHRRNDGPFVYATVIAKQGTNLKITYEGLSSACDTWSDFKQELHRFAKPESISKRPAHRFKQLKKGANIDINPTQIPSGWKSGEIRRLDQFSGQVQVAYKSGNNTYFIGII